MSISEIVARPASTVAAPVGPDRIAELALAFTGSGAELACLCSSDKIYAECAEISAHALQQVGARHIYLVGLPSQSEAAFRRAGICSFIHVSCDALATLNAAYNRIQNPKVSG